MEQKNQMDQLVNRLYLQNESRTAALALKNRAYGQRLAVGRKCHGEKKRCQEPLLLTVAVKMARLAGWEEYCEQRRAVGFTMC
jgi:hypothetical protein